MSVRAILERRRREQEEFLEKARGFATHLDPALGVRAVVVFGSVARGDFNLWSDIDVLVVADRVPTRTLDRLEAVGPRPPRVQPVVWTPQDWVREHERENPIALEAVEHGVWLVGSAEALAAV